MGLKLAGQHTLYPQESVTLRKSFTVFPAWYGRLHTAIRNKKISSLVLIKTRKLAFQYFDSHPGQATPGSEQSGLVIVGHMGSEAPL